MSRQRAPFPMPILQTVRRFRRIVRAMALLSVATAVLAVALIASGSDEWRIQLLIATGLAAGLSVFIAAALVGVLLLNVSSRNDRRASRFSDGSSL